VLKPLHGLVTSALPGEDEVSEQREERPSSKVNELTVSPLPPPGRTESSYLPARRIFFSSDASLRAAGPLKPICHRSARRFVESSSAASSLTGASAHYQES
jgi:hypothetical protein